MKKQKKEKPDELWVVQQVKGILERGESLTPEEDAYWIGLLERFFDVPGWGHLRQRFPHRCGYGDGRSIQSIGHATNFEAWLQVATRKATGSDAGGCGKGG